MVAPIKRIKPGTIVMTPLGEGRVVRSRGRENTFVYIFSHHAIYPVFTASLKIVEQPS